MTPPPDPNGTAKEAQNHEPDPPPIEAGAKGRLVHDKETKMIRGTSPAPVTEGEDWAIRAAKAVGQHLQECVANDDGDATDESVADIIRTYDPRDSTPPQMSPEEREAQRRSFAFGNANIDNPRITRKMIDEAADAMPAPSSPVAAMTREEREELRLKTLDRDDPRDTDARLILRLISDANALQAEADRLKARLGEAGKVIEEARPVVESAQCNMESATASTCNTCKLRERIKNFLAAAKSGQEEKKCK